MYQYQSEKTFSITCLTCQGQPKLHVPGLKYIDLEDWLSSNSNIIQEAYDLRSKDCKLRLEE